MQESWRDIEGGPRIVRFLSENLRIRGFFLPNQRKVEKENLTIRGKFKKRIWQSEESEKVKVRIILGCMEQCEQELCFCIESENNLKK